MNTSIKKTIISFVASFALANPMLFGMPDALAQQKAVSAKDQLIGSWKVLSYRSQLEGQQEWREPLGPKPKGYVMFSSAGRFMQLITASSGRKLPTNDAERAALLNSMSAFSGKYVVEKDQLTIMVDTSWSEAHQGERQKQMRFFKIEGDKLTWRTPPQIGTRSTTAGISQGKTVTEIVMEREK